LVAALFTGFSVLALALAAIGLFSVVSYGVGQRTNEFGGRMALGATGADLLRLVFISTASEVAGGIGCGILCSLLFTRILSKWAESSAQNPFVFAGVTLVLLVTAAFAALLPARRAGTVDPMTALRYE
jgi:ABC-type antimicrobial peptide transport system permease subunit